MILVDHNETSQAVANIDEAEILEIIDHHRIDGLVFKDEDGQVIFNQHSFCELVKHLLVELVGISYEEASQIVECSPLAEPVADAMGVAIFSHDLPYYWAMFFYYGNGYWQKGIPAQPEDMDAYEALENKIMEKYDLKEPFIWT